MQGDDEVYVGLDVPELKVSVALAEAGRDGEVRFLGEVENTPGGSGGWWRSSRNGTGGSPSATRPARPATASSGRSPPSATTAPWSPPR